VEKQVPEHDAALVDRQFSTVEPPLATDDGFPEKVTVVCASAAAGITMKMKETRGSNIFFIYFPSITREHPSAVTCLSIRFDHRFALECCR